MRVQSELVPVHHPKGCRRCAQPANPGEELRELKAKLKVLQDMKPPEDKDALIKYLVERLSQAEQAIEAAEQCIEAEKNSRKKVSKDIKAKNYEL